MALSANSKVDARPALEPKAQVQVRNTSVCYSGGLQSLTGYDSTTAADIGRIRPWSASSFQIPFGWKIFDAVTGNTSPGTGVVIPEAELDLSARILSNVAVTGLGGTVADNGRLVYMTDDTTLTLTRGSQNIPVGYVVRFRTSTNADVEVFSMDTIWAISLAGGAHQLLSLGTLNAVTIANGTTLTVKMTSHGRLNNIYAVCVTVPTGAGATTTLTPNIAGSAASAGVVTLALADTAYQVKQGTAFTAGSTLDVFHEGQLLTIVASATTAFTAGAYNLYADFILEGGV